MSPSAYNFNRCKLCGEMTAEPTYNLGKSQIYSCHNCDFHFLNQLDNQPKQQSTPFLLDDKARRYIESRLGEAAHLHPARIKLVKKHLNLNAINSLDIGAGLGQFQFLLKGEGINGEGIEPSIIRKEYAREKFDINLHEQLVDHPFWQLKFSHHFDLITLWDVIEHVNFPLETLKAAVNLLKTNGILFLETPSRETLPYRLSEKLYQLSGGKISLFLPSFYSTARYGHKQIFTRQQMIDLFESLGLRIVCSQGSYSSSRFLSDKIILAGQKIT